MPWPRQGMARRRRLRRLASCHRFCVLRAHAGLFDHCSEAVGVLCSHRSLSTGLLVAFGDLFELVMPSHLAFRFWMVYCGGIRPTSPRLQGPSWLVLISPSRIQLSFKVACISPSPIRFPTESPAYAAEPAVLAARCPRIPSIVQLFRSFAGIRVRHACITLPSRPACDLELLCAFGTSEHCNIVGNAVCWAASARTKRPAPWSGGGATRPHVPRKGACIRQEMAFIGQEVACIWRGAVFAGPVWLELQQIAVHVGWLKSSGASFQRRRSPNKFFRRGVTLCPLTCCSRRSHIAIPRWAAKTSQGSKPALGEDKRFKAALKPFSSYI